jgi:hypothetical protein
MRDECEVGKNKGDIKLLLKSSKEAAMFNIPIQQIDLHNLTYAFTTVALQRDLEFNPGMLKYIDVEF